MSTDQATGNKRAAADAGIDVVEAVKAWVDTMAKKGPPPGAVTAKEFAELTGTSEKMASEKLLALYRDGSWDRAACGGHGQLWYWPVSMPGL